MKSRWTLFRDTPVSESGYDEMEAAGLFSTKDLSGFIQEPFLVSALGEKFRAARARDS